MRKTKHRFESNDLKLLHTLTQPTRRKVLEVLLGAESLYIKKIAEIINESERNTSFHLARLADEGFVEGEFKHLIASNLHPSGGCCWCTCSQYPENAFH